MILLTLLLSAPVPPARPHQPPCVQGAYTISNGTSSHWFYLCDHNRYVSEWGGVVTFGTWAFDGRILSIEEDWMGSAYPWHFHYHREPGDVYFRHGKVDFKVRRVYPTR
jgi:hypothetical protein